MEGPRRNEPVEESTEHATAETFYNPDYASFDSGNLEELVEKWRANHQELLSHIESGTIPFFGLHGTPRVDATHGLEGLLESRQGNLEMATFYEKDLSEKFLYQLYNAAIYTSVYAKARNSQPGSLGGILIFDLEQDGKNITDEWEHLKPSAGTSTLVTDSQSESEYFESMGENENLLYRTDQLFSQELFDECFRGFVDLGKLEQYMKSIPPKPDMEELARSILQLRFFAQQIVKQAFSMVESPKKTSL
jgi:hypothetical protein